jgi:hypothetical protein
VLLALVGTAGLGLAQHQSEQPSDLGSLLRVGQPILESDRRLQQAGWRPSPAAQAGDLDRERAGNRLSSLSACAGSGLGLCRYDYRRGPATLGVITVPAGPDTPGGAQVLRWVDGASGRSWGLCQGVEAGTLVPCNGP